MSSGGILPGLFRFPRFGISPRLQWPGPGIRKAQLATVVPPSHGGGITSSVQGTELTLKPCEQVKSMIRMIRKISSEALFSLLNGPGTWVLLR